MAGKGSMAIGAAGKTADLVSPAIASGDPITRSASDAGSSGGAAKGGDVVDMMGRLKLTPREATPLILEDEGEEDPPCPLWALVGKVLAPNTLHVNTITSVVRPAWGNPKGLAVRHLGPNLFLAKFDSEADKTRIAKGGPWTLGNKHAILLKDYDVNVRPEETVFNEMPVWARIMRLGYEMMNADRGTPLAALLGAVEQVEVDEDGRAWGSYLRVRVTIDPSEPIMRYVSVFSKKKNKTVEYEVMYEKLPIYCFSCGMIGHSSIVCPNPAERDDDGKLPYSGDRLCVPEPRRRESSVSTEHSQNGRGARHGTDVGSGSQASAPSSGSKKKADGAAEVSSPAKKQTRTRRSTPYGRKNANMAGKQAVPQDDTLAGKKRKNSKQVYVPRTPAAQPPTEVNAGALVISGGNTLATIVHAHEAQVDEASDDSNKKQKTTVDRSADQAAADAQPRRTQ
ncbi:hypothetical protein QYE76_066230 [Lolium multiflorum]|uniref:CCHC-type domain-containing protein n=1 Tax=Lolium multiflorum TaxID=4521 RepID=A0AAD8WAN4_LOLMU|nr:hypothetical protein QYE76_066230 [Lolium multiflorum]